MVKTDRSNSLAILYIQMLSKNKFRIFGSSKKVTFMVNDDHKVFLVGRRLSDFSRIPPSL